MDKEAFVKGAKTAADYVGDKVEGAADGIRNFADTAGKAIHHTSDAAKEFLKNHAELSKRTDEMYQKQLDGIDQELKSENLTEKERKDLLEEKRRIMKERNDFQQHAQDQAQSVFIDVAKIGAIGMGCLAVIVSPQSKEFVKSITTNAGKIASKSAKMLTKSK